MFQFIFNREKIQDAKPILTKNEASELDMQDAQCYLPMKWNELDKMYKDPSVKNFQLRQIHMSLVCIGLMEQPMQNVIVIISI